ncbi:hypothetical protein Pmani_018703 [Petrolisthes manimaculis]|uniref:Uncharacterized protein n=1 Tax=Petrolisthes manimaculis TaxID=1843537 RepID=A0AAE1PLZ4_9EUCA|nr:hypothetical protein Pmani_018703 [Petrolisthes manimaculis]
MLEGQKKMWKIRRIGGGAEKNVGKIRRNGGGAKGKVEDKKKLWRSRRNGGGAEEMVEGQTGVECQMAEREHEWGE